MFVTKCLEQGGNYAGAIITIIISTITDLIPLSQQSPIQRLFSHDTQTSVERYWVGDSERLVPLNDIGVMEHFRYDHWGL